MRKFPALLGAGGVNHATGSHLVVTEKNTGTVFPNLKGVFSFHVTLPNVPIGDAKVASYPVDIVSIQIER